MWAGTSGSGPCANPTSGSEGISGAGYTASYSYDNLDRITGASVVDGSGTALSDAEQGPFTYQDSAHLHAVTGVGFNGVAPQYTACYDAAGDLLCRAPTRATTCTGSSPTGQQLSYDALRRLIGWQNAPGSSPTASEQYAYDGEGTRVWQQATSVNGSTTTTTDTAYELGTDETTTTTITGQPSATTNTRSYPLPGGALAERDGTGLYYLATDQLGTPIASLRLDDGVLVGTQLRTPYGQARYSSASGSYGGMHSSFGFTGQREDVQAAGSSGLTYFNARYYDPLVGRFTSADTLLHADPLLDRYAYVGGRVESATDPSGHDLEGEGENEDGGYGSWDGYDAIGSPEMPMPYSNINDPFSDAFPAPTDISAYGVDGTLKDLTYADGSAIIDDPNTRDWYATDAKGNVTEVDGEPENVAAAQEADIKATEGDADARATGNPGRAGDPGQGQPNDNAGGNTGGKGGSGGNGGNGDGGSNSNGTWDDGSGTTTLYWAVDSTELNDVLRFGDYGVNESGAPKDFALNEQGARDFAASRFNRGRLMTVTSVDVPTSFVDTYGEMFNDPHAAGAAVSFSYDLGVVEMLYKVMSLPRILDAPWVPLLP